MRKYILACEICQRVESSPFAFCPASASACPGRVLGLCLNGLCLRIPRQPTQEYGILVFLDRFSKKVHLVAVTESINASACGRVFVDTVFRLHGLSRELVSGRDLRFTAEFRRSVFKHSKHAKRCPHLTTQKHMVGRNLPIVSFRGYFCGTADRDREEQIAAPS